MIKNLLGPPLLQLVYSIFPMSTSRDPAESIAYVSAIAAVGVSAAISALLVATHAQRRKKKGARPSLLDDAPGLLGKNWHVHELKIGGGTLRCAVCL